jgi:hypothetical protein
MSIFDVAENENTGFGGKGSSASHRVQALMLLFNSVMVSMISFIKNSLFYFSRAGH